MAPCGRIRTKDLLHVRLPYFCCCAGSEELVLTYRTNIRLYLLVPCPFCCPCTWRFVCCKGIKAKEVPFKSTASGFRPNGWNFMRQYTRCLVLRDTQGMLSLCLSGQGRRQDQIVCRLGLLSQGQNGSRTLASYSVATILIWRPQGLRVQPYYPRYLYQSSSF
jgi:hypothetical protein